MTEEEIVILQRKAFALGAVMGNDRPDRFGWNIEDIERYAEQKYPLPKIFNTVTITDDGTVVEYRFLPNETDKTRERFQYRIYSQWEKYPSDWIDMHGTHFRKFTLEQLYLMLNLVRNPYIRG